MGIGMQSGSYSEQVAVRAGARQREHEDIVFDAIDEQPVWLDVAFAVARPVTGKGVVLVNGRQGLATGEDTDHIIDQIHIQMPFHA